MANINRTQAAQAYRDRLFAGAESPLASTDPELVEIWENFAFDEVASRTDIDERTRFVCILAALMGCQGTDLFREMVPAALNAGVTPVELKEIVYQGVDYLGMGRVYPFVRIASDVLDEKCIDQPLEPRSTTTRETRLAAGSQAQVDIFGDGMKGFAESGPAERRHINQWLAANCFGDFYTRKGLDLRERELITFCFIAAQGGCEPQLTSHAGGNMAMGNSRAFLIGVVSQLVPYLGYPRSLNALTCIDNAARKRGELD
ncbi:MAG: carboxymuconolactone decarboxylase family protein [Tractidigestivibacter sp.]|jgi:4-carboxymuconolactone decarboxylase|uniref:carboxymuconolactone decarboxylase family protein n=1 Tax=Tractidigestivibacter sp. TaxID=2847320 RepID=UPI003D92CCA6